MTHNVLCVCWDKSLQRSRVWVLESAGLKVRAASTPEDAVGALARHRFDLLVLGHSLTHEEKLEMHQLAKAVGTAVIALRLSDCAPEPEFDASVDSTTGPEALLASVLRLLNRPSRAARA